MDIGDDLWIAQATHDIDYDALQIVRVHEQLLCGDVVVLPEEVNLFADLPCAAVVDPFELAHR